MLPNPRPEWWPEHLEIADATVAVESIVTPLCQFLGAAADLHWQNYAKPLVVTSGNDGNHAPGSKHYIWKAVDIRSRDLDPVEGDMFARQLVPLQRLSAVGIFDERYIGQPHWHVEAA
jgi:hypothetical protein